MYRTVDEDGHERLEFIDRSGHRILDRRLDGSGIRHDTYYVYDMCDNLVHIIPPEAERLFPRMGGSNDDLLERLCHSFRYDVFHRLTMLRRPGSEPEYYVYDKLDRVIFSQDGNQRLTGTWSVNKYTRDFHLAVEGYAVMEGATRETLQQQWGHRMLIESPSPASEAGLLYTDTCGISGFIPMKAYFYNDYSHWRWALPHDSGYPADTPPSSRGLLTGTATKHGGTCMVTALVYDRRRRVIAESSRDYWMESHGHERYYDYSFRGVLQRMKTAVSIYAGGEAVERHTAEWEYTRDRGDRITRATLSIDGGIPCVAWSGTYDAIGRLCSYTPGDGLPVASGIPGTVTYSYDTGGRVTMIESPWFSQELYYTTNPNDSTAAVSYSGSLNAATERTSTPSSPVSSPAMTETAMSYRYDALGRLLSATDTRSGGGFGESFGYDRNGNILELTRSFSGTTVQDAAIVRHGNRIRSVYDVSDDSRTGEVPQFPSGDYPHAVEYDANGNRTLDRLRGIDNVNYMPRTNRPTSVTMSDGSRLRWEYHGDGELYRYVTTSAPIIYIASIKENGDTVWRSRSVTDIYTHIGDFVRINNDRWRLYHEAGHSDITVSDGAVSHRYYIRDRLGSTRTVLDETGQVLQSIGYYPSGLPYALGAGTAETDRLHGGKQFIDHSGVGLHDNGARMLDGLLGEFLSPDPLSEKYPDFTPYANCASNPLSFIDPTGRDIWRIDDRGYIKEHEETTEEDKFIMVTGQNEVMTDTEGNELSITFPYGTVISQTSHTEPAEYDVYIIRGDDNGSRLFEFLSDNISGSLSQVEVGLTRTGYPGDRGRNYITTGHERGSEPGISYLYMTELYNRYSIREIIHSHPVSDYSGKSDNEFKKQVKKNQAENKLLPPKFMIYHVPKRNYFEF
ncbi:MAG: hypothetical protein IJY31_04895 [Muribaculaceae bacterium]|nr:hypothetical protein [Muribaculaceae bacterium]